LEKVLPFYSVGRAYYQYNLLEIPETDGEFKNKIINQAREIYHNKRE